jgi:hypothetical protein
MQYKLAVLLAALLCAGALAPITSQAIGFSIEIGDRPYYSHGPWYWHHGVRYYWVPGHWGWHHHHKVWIPGHYLPR